MEVYMKKKQEGKGADVQAVWFAAGTAALMACLERAVVVSFVEQFRVLVFLALNLLLLAILFTSRHPNCSSPPDFNQENDNVGGGCTEEPKEKGKAAEAPREQDFAVAAEEEEVGGGGGDDGDDDDEVDATELNERAEAFIAKFRQHLASDAKE
ncbi:unnamed protein product [Cuscuta epithymum]|uniref:Uncharacterized protein n=1 Tax=Cuscuta epithymum TaxID=186058 RepID=A0AAV0EQC0_9ASTE|nr:unnamed protein product [Cuscuta epithymum]